MYCTRMHNNGLDMLSGRDIVTTICHAYHLCWYACSCVYIYRSADIAGEFLSGDHRGWPVEGCLFVATPESANCCLREGVVDRF